MSLLLPLAAGVAGGAAGEVLRRTVRAGGHRMADEQERPAPGGWWLPVVGVTLWAATARVAWVSAEGADAAAGQWPGALAWGLFVLALSVPLLWLAAIDLDVHRLPDRITLPLVAATPVALGLVALVDQDSSAWLRAVLGGLALGAVYLVLAMIGDGMGGGDVKLAPSLGMALGYLGWAELVIAFMLTFALATAYGIYLLIFRRASRKTLFAFGPFMIAGTLLVLVLLG